MSFFAVWAWLALGAVAAPLSGTVVDSDGKPVAGAGVWLTTPATAGGAYQEQAHAETNAEGGFRLDIPAEGETPRRLTLWAYAPGASVVVMPLANRPQEGDEAIRLTLGPPARMPFRVQGADGKAVAGARIRPTIWPASLSNKLAVTTDAEGRAAMDGVAAKQGFRVDVSADGFVTQSLPVPQDAGEKTLRLLPVGRIVGRIVSDDPRAVAGWTLIASSSPEPVGGLSFPTSSVSGTSDASGQIALRPFAVGLVVFRIVPPEGSPFRGAAPAQVTLRVGESVAVRIPVRKAVRVEGSVREHESGKGAAGVKVSLGYVSPGGGNEEVVTDADGRFSRYMLPGKLRISLTWFNLPDRYFYAPDNTHWADYDLAAGEDTRTLAPLEVWPATVLKGVVVDEAGKPVAGVQVVGSAISRKFGDRPIPGSTQTDEHGAFALGRMPADSTVAVRGLILHRAEASAVTVKVNADGVQDAPITLRLVWKPTVSLRGRVLGPGGLPVSGATVTIVFRTGVEQNAYGNRKEEQILTGPDGTFRTPDGVPASDQYRASVTAEGMEAALSDWAKAPAVDLPDVVLRRVARLRQVTGRVIDSDGKGVAGAEVFQSGDGPRRSSDTTDGEGRFTVPGVYDAPAFVFVKKDGFRFAGRRIGAGDEPVEIVVSKTGGPSPAALKPVPPPVTRAEERARARALVMPVWNRVRSSAAEGQERLAALQAMALADTSRVVDMIENQTLRADGPLLLNVALALYEESPREAVATLDSLRPALAAATALVDLFDKVSDAPAELRRDLLTRALERAHEVEVPTGRVAALARVADRWFELGAAEKARPLLDEAGAAFKRVRSGSLPQVRADLADALARVNLTEALALVEGVENQARIAGIARRAAATDPAGAARVFGNVVQRPARLGALADVCAGMATKDLPKALELAERSGAPGVAALTVAAAARSKVSADPAGAKALLGDAFDRLERLSGRMVVPAVAMARLLPLAIRVDPDRSSEYLWRALAARPPRASGDASWSVTPDVRRQYLILAELAALVARYDRGAAEIVFAPVAENASALIDDRFRLSNEAAAILQAAAVFDPRAAGAMLNALPDDPQPQSNPRPGMSFIKDKARLVVARALALPPAIRRREALRIAGQPDLWPAVLDD